MFTSRKADGSRYTSRVSEIGVSRNPLGDGIFTMTGSAAQVEWAERIKRQVNDEFDRVALAFRTVAEKQDIEKRASTEAILAILEDLRIGVVNRRESGYFIHDWQNIGDQVRQMLFQDERYQQIKRAGAPSITK